MSTLCDQIALAVAELNIVFLSVHSLHKPTCVSVIEDKRGLHDTCRQDHTYDRLLSFSISVSTSAKLDKSQVFHEDSPTSTSSCHRCVVNIIPDAMLDD